MLRLTKLTFSVALTVGLGLAVQLGAQAPGRGGRGRGAAGAAPARAARRGNYEQNMRPLAAPDVIAHGKELYDANCASCHASDMMGSDKGGNLVASQDLLNDQNGELIEPIVAGSQASLGMPAQTLSKDDVDTIAAYMHSVAAQVGSQGRPPGPQETPGLKVIVGDAVAGKADFDTNCSSCHSAEAGGQRSVAGIGAKYEDGRSLQNAWVSGKTGFSFGGRGGGGGVGNPVTVTMANGDTLSGKLVSEDEFVVVLTTPDGVRHSFDRHANMTVTVTDPDEAHKDLILKLSQEPNGDTVMHNVTAYLATLK